MAGELDYNILIEKAMRDVVKYALKKAQKITDENLCFLFQINTKKRGLVLPDYVKKQYPEEITLILQHQFSNLDVKNVSFSVDLSFGGRFEHIIIPFSSLISFSDQVAGIELRFDMFDGTNIFDEYEEYIGEDYVEDTANTNVDFNNNLINFSDLKKGKL